MLLFKKDNIGIIKVFHSNRVDDSLRKLQRYLTTLYIFNVRSTTHFQQQLLHAYMQKYKTNIIHIIDIDYLRATSAKCY